MSVCRRRGWPIVKTTVICFDDVGLFHEGVGSIFYFMRVLPLFLFLSCTSVVEDTASYCPPLTDPCMNAENHQECLEVEATCEGVVLVAESCPLQFSCESLK